MHAIPGFYKWGGVFVARGKTILFCGAGMKLPREAGLHETANVT